MGSDSQAPAASRPAADELRELARRAASGDKRATRTLLGAVGPAMLQAARKVLGPRARDLEDVVQDAMEGLIEALPSFRGDCTVLHFAYRVAVLTALVDRRRISLREHWTVDAPEAMADASAGIGAASSEDGVTRARRRQALDMLLDELPAAQSEVLVLHAVLGFTIEEIAASVGRPAETIRSRLRLAKGALRDRISADRLLAEILEVTS